MGLVWVISMIVFTSSAVAIKSKRKIEETIAFTCFVFIFVLYICGLFGVLPVGVYLCIAISSLSFMYLMWYVVKDRKLLFFHLVTPGLLAFLLLCVWVWLAHRNRLLTSWDEFSHWGLVVKNMYNLNSFANAPDATTYFTGYPPGVALFQYLWCKLYGSYQDANLIRAINILSFSMLLPIFAKLNWNRYSAFIPVLFIVAVLPLTFFSGFFTELYVDAVLGIFFAYILYSYFFSDGFDAFCLLNLTLALLVLTLVKASGVGIAFLALIIIAIDWFLFKKQLNTKITQRRFTRYIPIACMLISILAAKYSWQLYLKFTDTSEAWAGMKQLTLSNMLHFISGQARAYRYTVLNNFIKAFWTKDFQSYLLHMNLIIWILLFAAIGFLLLWLIKDTMQRRRIGVALTGLFVGGILYSFSLLVLYLFTYSEYEATGLASFDRYMSTYLLGMLLFMSFTIISYSLQHAQGRAMVSSFAAVTAGILLFTNVKPCINVTYTSHRSIQLTATLRAPFDKLSQLCQYLNCKSDKLYFVSQQSKGYDYWITRYTVTPIKINEGCCWSIGTPYGSSDIWTKKITCREWCQELSDHYTYVYLHCIDTKFKDEFADAFDNPGDIQADTLYKVVKRKEMVKLQSIKM